MSLKSGHIDEALTRKALEKLRALLFKRCFMERWTPIQEETRWILSGRPNEKHHKKILPEYCYHIFELQRRTIYKAFSPLAEILTIKNKRRAHKAKTIAEAKKVISLNLEKLGAVFAVGEKSLQLYEQELLPELTKMGVLNPKKKKEFERFQMIYGVDWINQKLAKIQERQPNKPLGQIVGDEFSRQVETTRRAIPDWHTKAREWSNDGVEQFHAGVVRGSKDFINSKNELVGEKKLKLHNTYEFLLLAWPEIQSMMKAVPPKTRNHLWDWLTPFSHARWIEIQDLDQLNRLCNEIKLKLKKPGAPYKVK
jgi:hypothetical protein